MSSIPLPCCWTEICRVCNYAGCLWLQSTLTKYFSTITSRGSLFSMRSVAFNSRIWAAALTLPIPPALLPKLHYKTSWQILTTIFLFPFVMSVTNSQHSSPHQTPHQTASPAGSPPMPHNGRLFKAWLVPWLQICGNVWVEHILPHPKRAWMCLRMHPQSMMWSCDHASSENVESWIKTEKGKWDALYILHYTCI